MIDRTLCTLDRKRISTESDRFLSKMLLRLPAETIDSVYMIPLGLTAPGSLLFLFTTFFYQGLSVSYAPVCPWPVLLDDL